ncbi:MAG TPA: acyl-CoA dehydrogenase family protein [Acidimicrobiales bacterium]|nr:acyl-CoA dehydrogenase family protein [Acidimicrobiales bacterium]
MTTHTKPATLDQLIPADLLARMDERAPTYDHDNTFFTEDFQELKATGFLNIAVPTELGGHGLGLDQVSEAMGRIAYVAPATALALNMHVYWTGVAADLLRTGDESCRWILEESVAGKVFAALHGEAGNDVPLFYSTASAERVDGGWKINGHKIFGSLSPVWDYGGFHAADTSDPENPRIVHGFFPRDTAGLEILDTWDTLGMRATQSQDTVLTDAVATDDKVVRVCLPGFAGADLFQVAIFAWGLVGFASVYHGLARRAFDLTVENLPRKTSVALTRSMAHHPEVQHLVAEMRIGLDASEALLDRVASDWASGVEHPDWPVRLLALRHRVINESFDVVDKAMDLTGGAGAFRRNRMEQIFRDARMGRFHPGNTLLAHELIGKLSLGVDPDDALRWG